jgi:glycosyltransferase involved in cell wall biosynthesis
LSTIADHFHDYFNKTCNAGVSNLKIAEYLDIPMTERSGGVGTYIRSLSAEFMRLGHEVAIVDGLNKPRLFSNRHLINVSRNSDIHHFHEPSTALLAYCIETIFSKPSNIVITFHAPVLNKVLRTFYSIIPPSLYRKADLIMTTTKRNAEYLKSGGIQARVIPLWAEEYFCPTHSNRYVRKPYVLSVCAVDNYHSYKNYYMISKLGRVLGRRFKMDLLHVGVHDFVLPYVIHYGVVNNQRLRELYQNATAFVLPSIGPYEGFGIVAAEALSCATPALVSNGCGISEFLSDVFVSSLSGFQDRLCAMIADLVKNPRPIIDQAYQESLKFSYENCKTTVSMMLSCNKDHERHGV